MQKYLKIQGIKNRNIIYELLMSEKAFCLQIIDNIMKLDKKKGQTVI